MAIFKASDVLSAQVRVKERAGVWFLNWDVSPLAMRHRANKSANHYGGSGLYGICFDDELIYIGSYLGKNKDGANFAGDVVDARWWKHVGAITSRGCNLHIAPRTLRFLQEALGARHPMVAGFLSASDRQLLHKGAGDLGTCRRMLFAARHADAFLRRNVTPADVLARFSFVYVRIGELLDRATSFDLKHRVESAEKYLIRSLAPICNDKHVLKGADPTRIPLDRLEGILGAALKAQVDRVSDSVAVSSGAPPHEPTDVHLTEIDDEEGPDWAGAFWGKLPADDINPAKILVDGLISFGMRHGATVYYTGTDKGDLRFSVVRPGKMPRVCMSIQWKPRDKAFSIQSICAPERAAAFFERLDVGERVRRKVAGKQICSDAKVIATVDRAVAVRKLLAASLEVGWG